jgi:hypothetical protein
MAGIDLLTGHVHALVKVVAEGEGAVARYRLLDTTRAYAGTAVRSRAQAANRPPAPVAGPFGFVRPSGRHGATVDGRSRGVPLTSHSTRVGSLASASGSPRANSWSARVGRNQFAPVPVFQSWLAVAAATLGPSIVVIVGFVGPADSHCRYAAAPRCAGTSNRGPPLRRSSEMASAAT